MIVKNDNQLLDTDHVSQNVTLSPNDSIKFGVDEKFSKLEIKNES